MVLINKLEVAYYIKLVLKSSGIKVLGDESDTQDCSIIIFKKINKNCIKHELIFYQYIIYIHSINQMNNLSNSITKLISEKINNINSG